MASECSISPPAAASPGFGLRRAPGRLLVEAAEIDPLAVAAIRLNAEANQLAIEPLLGDIVGTPCRWDVILCGDVCYEAPMTRHIMPWLQACAAKIPVIIADPGRRYAPTQGFELIYEIEVPTSLELEDSATRRPLARLPGCCVCSTPEPYHSYRNVDWPGSKD